MGRGAADVHACDALLCGGPAEDGGDGGGGAGAAVFAVVTVDVDGSRGVSIADGAGKFELSGGLDAAVGDGEVDVSDASSGGLGDVGLSAVDADDGFDAEGSEGVEALVAFGLAAGDEALVEGDEVVDAREVSGGGVGDGGERVGGDGGCGGLPCCG